MSEENKVNADTIRLLRAVVKLSSALNEFDSIMYESKYFKFNFKRVSSNWAKLIQIHTDSLMRSLVEEDDKTFVDVYTQFEESIKDVDAGTKDRTDLVIFYAKLKSAMNDVEEMEENRFSFYPMFIHKYTSDVITQVDKQYKGIIDIKDANGHGIDYIVNYLDNLGKKIMYYGEQQA